MIDYHLTKRLDMYAGVMWSKVAGGLASGYLNSKTSARLPVCASSFNADTKARRASCPRRVKLPHQATAASSPPSRRLVPTWTLVPGLFHCRASVAVCRGKWCEQIIGTPTHGLAGPHTLPPIRHNASHVFRGAYSATCRARIHQCGQRHSRCALLTIPRSIPLLEIVELWRRNSMENLTHYPWPIFGATFWPLWLASEQELRQNRPP